jgi:high-affinity nickel-transport protein
MLIGLGVVTLRGAYLGFRQSEVAPPGAPPVPAAHRHGDYIHAHVHPSDGTAHPHPPDRTPLGWLDRRLGRLAPYRLGRPLVVGIVHGLSGSAAVALLVLATVPDPRWAMLYLAVFGVGTILGMLAITVALALPFAWADRRYRHLTIRLRVASGLVSICFGVFIAWRIGVVEGLLAGVGPR